MKTMRAMWMAMAVLLLLPMSAAMAAGSYSDTVTLFKNAGRSGHFFGNAYGYAVFPTIAKGGLGVGAAHGNGRVYEKGVWIGHTSMTQVSVGLQAGGQAYSMIIFFEDKRALDEFTSGNFEFDAEAQAVVITAAAGGEAGTEGTSGEASGGEKDAKTIGGYYKGMATFVIVKGGAMAQAVVAGQKFSYHKRGSDKD